MMDAATAGNILLRRSITMRSNRGNTLSTKHISRTCPNCGSSFTHSAAGHVSPAYGMATTTMSCSLCGYVWDEYYKLIYNGYDDGYYHYGPDGDAREEGQIPAYKTHNKQLQ